MSCTFCKGWSLWFTSYISIKQTSFFIKELHVNVPKKFIHNKSKTQNNANTYQPAKKANCGMPIHKPYSEITRHPPQNEQCYFSQ